MASVAELLSEPRVAPSILSADFSRLGAQVRDVLDAGARIIHVDVMDGHFVPPITMGPLVVAAIADEVHGAGGILDVHLMIERPEHQVAEFARAGADQIDIHAEATPHLHYALGAIRDAGARAAVALNPATPVEALRELDGTLEHALCMTVNPGWGGQPFIPTSAAKVARLHALLGQGASVGVDGGVDERTAEPCVAAGARLLVAGSAVFGAPDPAAAYAGLAAAAGAA